MATGTSTLNDMVPAEIVAAQALATARAGTPGASLLGYDRFRGSNVKSYTRFAKVTAAAVNEGTDGTPTDMTDTQVSATLGEIAIGTVILDTLDVASSVVDTAQMIGVELGRGFADKIDIDLLAKSANLTDSVGSTGVALDEDKFLQGIMESEANDIGGLPLVAILYPKQVHNLRTAIGGVSENQSGVYSRPDILSPIAPAQVGGYCFSVFNVPIFQSTNVPTANGAVDSGGMLAVPGRMDAPIWLSVGIQSDGSDWFARYETQRDASLRGMEAWVTGYVATFVPMPERGCRILSVR